MKGKATDWLLEAARVLEALVLEAQPKKQPARDEAVAVRTGVNEEGVRAMEGLRALLTAEEGSPLWGKLAEVRACFDDRTVADFWVTTVAICSGLGNLRGA